MDSKPKTDVGFPRTAMPAIRLDEGKPRRTNRWLVGALVVLAVALVAVGTWAIVDRSNREVTTKVGLADAATVKMIDDLAAAGMTDGERFASFFTEDGVLEVPLDGGVIEGREDIARQLQQDLMDNVERVGPVVQSGNFVAHGVVVENPDRAAGITIYELTPSGEIAHMWSIVD